MRRDDRVANSFVRRDSAPLATPHTFLISQTRVLSGPHQLQPGATALRVAGPLHKRILLFQARGQQTRASLATDLTTSP